MAPKMSLWSAKIDRKLPINNIQIEELICPICCSTLMEPVLLPCRHAFCLSCLNRAVELSSLTCPCCRKRFATWLRAAKKENKVVDQNLWDFIKSSKNKASNSKRRITRRSKKDSVDATSDIFSVTAPTQIQISQPGEICKEYEEQLQAFRKQIEIEKENELKASVKYIVDLFREELKNQIESSVKAEDKSEKNLNETMLVANPGHTPYSLNTAGTKKNNYSSAKSQFAKATEETTSTSSATATSTLAAAAAASTSSLVKGLKTISVRINRGTELLKQTVHKEILAKFPSQFTAATSGKGALAVPPTNTHRSPNRYSGSTDSLNLEMCHFKPIRTVPTTPNKRSSLPALETPKAKRIILKDRNINHNDGPKANALSRLLLTSHLSAFYVVKSAKYAPQLPSSQHYKISKSSASTLPIASQSSAQRILIKSEVVTPEIGKKTLPNRLNPVVRLKRCRIDTQKVDIADIQVRPKRVLRTANIKGPAVKRKLNGQFVENIQNVAPKVRRSNRHLHRKEHLAVEGDKEIIAATENPHEAETLAQMIKEQKRCEKIIIQERLDFKIAKKLEKKLSSCEEPPAKRVTRSISKLSKFTTTTTTTTTKPVRVMPRRTTRESAKSARENFRGVN